MDDNQYDQKLKKLKAYLPFLENIISNFEHIPERQPQVTKMKTLHKLLLNDKRLNPEQFEKIDSFLQNLQNKHGKTIINAKSNSKIITEEKTDLYQRRNSSGVKRNQLNQCNDNEPKRKTPDFIPDKQTIKPLSSILDLKDLLDASEECINKRASPNLRAIPKNKFHSFNKRNNIRKKFIKRPISPLMQRQIQIAENDFQNQQNNSYSPFEEQSRSPPFDNNFDDHHYSNFNNFNSNAAMMNRPNPELFQSPYAEIQSGYNSQTNEIKLFSEHADSYAANNFPQYHNMNGMNNGAMNNYYPHNLNQNPYPASNVTHMHNYNFFHNQPHWNAQPVNNGHFFRPIPESGRVQPQVQEQTLPQNKNFRYTEVMSEEKFDIIDPYRNGRPVQNDHFKNENIYFNKKLSPIHFKIGSSEDEEAECSRERFSRRRNSRERLHRRSYSRERNKIKYEKKYRPKSRNTNRRSVSRERKSRFDNYRGRRSSNADRSKSREKPFNSQKYRNPRPNKNKPLRKSNVEPQLELDAPSFTKKPEKRENTWSPPTDDFEETKDNETGKNNQKSIIKNDNDQDDIEFVKIRKNYVNYENKSPTSDDIELMEISDNCVIYENKSPTMENNNNNVKFLVDLKKYDVVDHCSKSDSACKNLPNKKKTIETIKITSESIDDDVVIENIAEIDQKTTNEKFIDDTNNNENCQEIIVIDDEDIEEITNQYSKNEEPQTSIPFILDESASYVHADAEKKDDDDTMQDNVDKLKDLVANIIENANVDVLKNILSNVNQLRDVEESHEFATKINDENRDESLKATIENSKFEKNTIENSKAEDDISQTKEYSNSEASSISSPQRKVTSINNKENVKSLNTSSSKKESSSRAKINFKSMNNSSSKIEASSRFKEDLISNESNESCITKSSTKELSRSTSKNPPNEKSRLKSSSVEKSTSLLTSSKDVSSHSKQSSDDSSTTQSTKVSKDSASTVPSKSKFSTSSISPSSLKSNSSSAKSKQLDSKKDSNSSKKDLIVNKSPFKSKLSKESDSKKVSTEPSSSSKIFTKDLSNSQKSDIHKSSSLTSSSKLTSQSQFAKQSAKQQSPKSKNNNSKSSSILTEITSLKENVSENKIAKSSHDSSSHQPSCSDESDSESQTHKSSKPFTLSLSKSVNQFTSPKSVRAREPLLTPPTSPTMSFEETLNVTSKMMNKSKSGSVVYSMPVKSPKQRSEHDKTSKSKNDSTSPRNSRKSLDETSANSDDHNDSDFNKKLRKSKSRDRESDNTSHVKKDKKRRDSIRCSISSENNCKRLDTDSRQNKKRRDSVREDNRAKKSKESNSKRHCSSEHEKNREEFTKSLDINKEDNLSQLLQNLEETGEIAPLLEPTISKKNSSLDTQNLLSILANTENDSSKRNINSSSCKISTNTLNDDLSGNLSLSQQLENMDSIVTSKLSDNQIIKNFVMSKSTINLAERLQDLEKTETDMLNELVGKIVNDKDVESVSTIVIEDGKSSDNVPNEIEEVHMALLEAFEIRKRELISPCNGNRRPLDSVSSAKPTNELQTIIPPVTVLNPQTEVQRDGRIDNNEGNNRTLSSDVTGVLQPPAITQKSTVESSKLVHIASTSSDSDDFSEDEDKWESNGNFDVIPRSQLETPSPTRLVMDIIDETSKSSLNVNDMPVENGNADDQEVQSILSTKTSENHSEDVGNRNEQVTPVFNAEHMQAVTPTFDAANFSHIIEAQNEKDEKKNICMNGLLIPKSEPIIWDEATENIKLEKVVVKREDLFPTSTEISNKIYRIDNLICNKRETTAGFITDFVCGFESCQYTMNESEQLYIHLEEDHPNELWEGYCYSCEYQTKESTENCLKEELDHMLLVHLNLKPINLDDSTSNNILIRNISTMLSEQCRPRLRINKAIQDVTGFSIGCQEAPITHIPSNVLPVTNQSNNQFATSVQPIQRYDDGIHVRIPDPAYTTSEVQSISPQSISTVDPYDYAPIQALQSQISTIQVAAEPNYNLPQSNAVVSNRGYNNGSQIISMSETPVETSANVFNANNIPSTNMGGIQSNAYHPPTYHQALQQSVVNNVENNTSSQVLTPLVNRNPTNISPNRLSMRHEEQPPQPNHQLQPTHLPLNLSTSSCITRYPTEDTTNQSVINSTEQSALYFNTSNESRLRTTIPINQGIASNTSTTNFSIPSNILANSIYLIQPWLNKSCKKKPSICQVMLDKTSLDKFYKCMGNSCAFSTNDCNEFYEHLGSHERYVDELHRNNTTPCNDVYGWCACAYCDVILTTITNLMNHLNSKHKTSIYQCGYCFYRSFSVTHIYHHSMFYHRNVLKQMSLIVSDKVAKKVEFNYNDLETQMKQNVTPFICLQCNSITYSKVIYIQHMKTHGNKKLKCNVCSEEYNHARSFNQHLQSHNIGILNCIFCNYNSSSYVKMVHHLLQKHSSEPMYISARHKASHNTLNESRFPLYLVNLGREFNKIKSIFVRMSDEGIETREIDFKEHILPILLHAPLIEVKTRLEFEILCSYNTQDYESSTNERIRNICNANANPNQLINQGNSTTSLLSETIPPLPEGLSITLTDDTTHSLRQTIPGNVVQNSRNPLEQNMSPEIQTIPPLPVGLSITLTDDTTHRLRQTVPENVVGNSRNPLEQNMSAEIEIQPRSSTEERNEQRSILSSVEQLTNASPIRNSGQSINYTPAPISPHRNLISNMQRLNESPFAAPLSSRTINDTQGLTTSNELVNKLNHQTTSQIHHQLRTPSVIQQNDNGFVQPSHTNVAAKIIPHRVSISKNPQSSALDAGLNSSKSTSSAPNISIQTQIPSNTSSNLQPLTLQRGHQEHVVAASISNIQNVEADRTSISTNITNQQQISTNEISGIECIHHGLKETQQREKEQTHLIMDAAKISSHRQSISQASNSSKDAAKIISHRKSTAQQKPPLLQLSKSLNVNEAAKISSHRQSISQHQSQTKATTSRDETLKVSSNRQSIVQNNEQSKTTTSHERRAKITSHRASVIMHPYQESSYSNENSAKTTQHRTSEPKIHVSSSKSIVHVVEPETLPSPTAIAVSARELIWAPLETMDTSNINENYNNISHNDLQSRLANSITSKRKSSDRSIAPDISHEHNDDDDWLCVNHDENRPAKIILRRKSYVEKRKRVDANEEQVQPPTNLQQSNLLTNDLNDLERQTNSKNPDNMLPKIAHTSASTSNSLQNEFIECIEIKDDPVDELELTLKQTPSFINNDFNAMYNKIRKKALDLNTQISNVSCRKSNNPAQNDLQQKIDEAARICCVRENDFNNISCPFQNCNIKSPSFEKFNLHLWSHANSSLRSYTECYLCSDKKLNNYSKRVEHIKQHFNTRFLCYFCSAKSTNRQSLLEHILENHLNDVKHETNLRDLPLNPQCTNKETDVFVICSTMNTAHDIFEYGLKLIERNYQQMAFYRTEFDPSEIANIQKLPKHFLFDVKCSKCDYVTKLKKQLLNHFIAHKENFIKIETEVVNICEENDEPQNKIIRHEINDNLIVCNTEKVDENITTELLSVSNYSTDEPAAKRQKMSDTETALTLPDSLYCCSHCNFSAMRSLLEKHHREKHDNLQFKPRIIGLSICREVLAEKVPESDTDNATKSSSKSDTRRSDQIQFQCLSCTRHSQRLKNIVAHWKERHQYANGDKPARPFLFKITKYVKCYHCNQIKLFRDMPSHHKKHHDGHNFLTIDSNKQRTCGECPFKFINYDDLFIHYKECHETNVVKVNHLPDDLMQENVIENYINFEIFPSKFVCKICTAESDSIEDLKKHHKNTHSNQRDQTVHIESKKTYLCCSNVPLNEADLVEHIQMKHTTPNATVEKCLNIFDEVRISFPNGFTCHRGELRYSKHGALHEIFAAMPNSSIDNESITSSTSTTPVAAIRRRRKSTFLDIETMLTCMTTALKQIIAENKIKVEVEELPTTESKSSKMELSTKNSTSSTHASSSNKSSKTKEYKSHYRMKPENTNYSHILTTVPAGCKDKTYKVVCNPDIMKYVLKIRDVSVTLEDFQLKKY